MKVLKLLALILLHLSVATPPAAAHEIVCDKRVGVDLARCERHQRMFAKCGPIKGEAHFACDREFLLANPLNCTALKGDDAKACEAELGASKVCEAQQGQAYMRCVRDTLKPAAGTAPDKP